MVNLTDFLSNLTEIVTSLTTMFTSVMSIFMEPPLSLFIGVGLFVLMASLVAKYLMGRKK